MIDIGGHCQSVGLIRDIIINIEQLKYYLHRDIIIDPPAAKSESSSAPRCPSTLGMYTLGMYTLCT